MSDKPQIHCPKCGRAISSQPAGEATTGGMVRPFYSCECGYDVAFTSDGDTLFAIRDITKDVTPARIDSPPGWRIIDH